MPRSSGSVDRPPMRGLNRRGFLRLTAAAAAAASGALGESSFLRAADAGPSIGPSAGFPMAKFPEKTDLILLTDRPPNLETPLKYFKTDITPSTLR